MTPAGSEATGTPEEWARRRRLAEVFGDVLPDSTGDDRDEAGSESAGERERGDAWLRDQVPPHHG